MIVESKSVGFSTSLVLDSGHRLPDFRIAYETYGELSREKDNAILICHGLTSDHHAAGRYSDTDKKPGWWDAAIGAGKPFDTDRDFVVCSNVLGGFGGSTGPASLAPGQGVPYGSRFPVVTIGDMVKAQARLADYLEIDRFHTVAGGCMGGFQVLDWLRRFPGRVSNAIVISAGPRVSAHTVALWKVLSDAIRSDPAWNDGDYYSHGAPDQGMALAARIGALFWMSREAMEQRFGLKTVTGKALSYSFEPDFEIEQFLQGIGRGAAAKIDPNSLLYLMRAMSYFDLSRGVDNLAEVFSDVRTRTLLVSYAGDWRYPARETEEIRAALEQAGAPVEHKVFESDFGHGAFIYDFADLGEAISRFLEAA